jgi:hypothetical protein
MSFVTKLIDVSKSRDTKLRSAGRWDEEGPRCPGGVAAITGSAPGGEGENGSVREAQEYPE